MTNNKALFMKWIQNLFYVQCVALVARLISELPFIGSWFSWVTRLITIATIVIIFKLIPLNERYRKAVIFMVVSTVSTLFLSKLGLLLFVGSICAFIATYQEYIGHSELIAEVDEKLSKNWRSLFNWELWGGLALSFVVTGIVMVLSVTNAVEQSLVVGIPMVILDVFNIILQIVYLMLVKRMLTVYANYEPQAEEMNSEEI